MHKFHGLIVCHHYAMDLNAPFRRLLMINDALAQTKNKQEVRAVDEWIGWELKLYKFKLEIFLIFFFFQMMEVFEKKLK